eukprot:g6864.t1
MENVDSKEGARLILAYERVAELLSSSGDSGVQREHLLMGLVLHCTKNEETLLQNVLNTRDDLVLFYQNAEAAVAQFMEWDQSIPEPPMLSNEEEQVQEVRASPKKKGVQSIPEPPLLSNEKEQVQEVRTSPKRAQPHVPTNPKSSALKRKASSSSPGSRRLSLRSFFSSSSKGRKSSLSMRGTALRNEEWTIENINKALIDDNHSYEVQIPIRMLDGQIDRVNCTSSTTITDVLREIVKIHKISLTNPEDLLAIYECHDGMDPRRCKKDEFVLGIVVRWEAKQDHIDDDGVTFILKRWRYEPEDEIEVLAENASNIMDKALRLTYVDLNNHIVKGEYKVLEMNLPRFSATKLFFENDGNKEKKFLKNLKKKIKDNFKMLLPTTWINAKGRTKKQTKTMIEDIARVYTNLTEQEDALYIMKEFIHDYKSLCYEVYGSAFFNVKYSFSMNTTVVSNGRLGVNWQGLTLYGTDTNVTVTIEYLSVGNITYKNDKAIVIDYSNDKTLLLTSDVKNLEIYNLLVQYQRGSSANTTNNENIGTEKIRRESVADTMRRNTVKQSTMSIMDDMADAFGDWDFALDDNEDVDQNIGRNEKIEFKIMDSNNVRGTNNLRTNQESWEAHVDPKSGKIYYHDKYTGETKWELASSGDYNIQHDEKSGKNYFIHKKTKRTSWVIADCVENQKTRESRALSNVYEEE